jgi:ArsR family transcriptional regulator
VTSRREGKAIYYRLTDWRVIMMVDMVYKLFCKQP